MRRTSIARLLFTAAICLLLPLALASAQQPRVPGNHETLITFYYKDPRPERLVGFLETFRPGPENWGAWPPVAGFYAVVFRKHPDMIDTLTSGRLDSRAAGAMAAALRLSGQQSKARKLIARIAEAGADPRLKSELANLPDRLDDLQVRTPTHMDILWGASFASGDGRHARKLIEYFARTANLSEPVAVDVAQVVLAMSGGPKEILGQLRGKHGDTLGREIVFAATALWAVTSNAQQHDFVDRTVAAWLRDTPASPAARALTALRRRR